MRVGCQRRLQVRACGQVGGVGAPQQAGVQQRGARGVQVAKHACLRAYQKCVKAMLFPFLAWLSLLRCLLMRRQVRGESPTHWGLGGRVALRGGRQQPFELKAEGSVLSTHH